MSNRASVLWNILKGLAKKWPEMVVKWTIVTTRLGELVFIITLLYESPKDSLGKCFVLLSIGTHLMKL